MPKVPIITRFQYLFNISEKKGEIDYLHVDLFQMYVHCCIQNRSFSKYVLLFHMWWYFLLFFSVFSVKKENWNRKEKIGNLSFFEIPSKIKVLFIINFNVTSYLLLSFAVFFCYYTFKLNRFYGFMVVSCICCSTLVFLVK